jgi:ATP-dependent Clp protease adapter protein ClpS
MTKASPVPTGTPDFRPRGSVCLLRVAGIPVYVHWSCFLGGLMLSAAGAFRTKLMLPLMVGYLLLVLIHEAGHAVAARWLGVHVFAIRMKGLGGTCSMEVAPGARATLIVFSAGLVAQIVLFTVTVLAQQLLTHPLGPTWGSFAFAFTFGNAMLFVCSVVPWTGRDGRSSDGRILLQLAVDCWHGRTILGGTLPAMNAASESPVFAPDTSLLAIPALVPSGFRQGLEILNDRHTPLDFVLDMFVRHVGCAGNVAVRRGVQIHNQGGLLLPIASLAEAERIAAAVAQDVAAAGHAFICRAVSVEADDLAATAASVCRIPSE